MKNRFGSMTGGDIAGMQERGAAAMEAANVWSDAARAAALEARKAKSEFTDKEREHLEKHGFAQHPSRPWEARRAIANPGKPNYAGGVRKYEVVSRHDDGKKFITTGASGFNREHPDIESAMARFAR